MIKKHLIFIISLFILSCNSSLDSCEISKARIFGFPSHITGPVGATENQIRTLDSVEVEDEQDIRQLLTELSLLDSIDFQEFIDHKVVIDVFCSNQPPVTINVSWLIVTVGKKSYFNTDTVNNLIASIIEKNR